MREIEGLESFGFEPSVSVGQSSLEGLRENIFRQIIDSEYFLFVDFKREQIVRNDSSGSMVIPPFRVFVLPSRIGHRFFLRMEAIGFQEEGMLREGILDVIQLNCQNFKGPVDLLGKVREQIAEKVGNRTGELNSPCIESQTNMGRWIGESIYWHVKVQNVDWRKPALDCRATSTKCVTHMAARSSPLGNLSLSGLGHL